LYDEELNSTRDVQIKPVALSMFERELVEQQVRDQVRDLLNCRTFNAQPI
jgi:hypothetical protein